MFFLVHSSRRIPIVPNACAALAHERHPSAFTCQKGLRPEEPAHSEGRWQASARRRFEAIAATLPLGSVATSATTSGERLFSSGWSARRPIRCSLEGPNSRWPPWREEAGELSIALDAESKDVPLARIDRSLARREQEGRPNDGYGMPPQKTCAPARGQNRQRATVAA